MQGILNLNIQNNLKFTLINGMVKKACLFLNLLFSCYYMSATTKDYLDSVRRSLQTTTNKIDKLNSLYTLSFEYGFINPRLGLQFGKQCLDLATHENNLAYQLNAYNGIANAYETMANFDSAKYFHTQSYEIAKKMKAPPKMALTLFNVGLCYKQLGDYNNALKSYLKAYKLLEQQASYNPRIHFYIGEIYMRMGDYVQAEYHSRLGIKKCIEFNHDYVIYNLYINLAKCHQHYGKIDSAIYVLNGALNGLQKNIDENSIAICYNALGDVHRMKNDFNKAFIYFSEELKLQQKLDNRNGLLLAYINLANSAAHLKNPDRQLISELIKKSIANLSSTKNNNDILLETYLKTAETYELIDKPNNAITYYKLYFNLKDSLLNKEKFQQILELQTKYETKKKEQEITTLKQSDLIKSLEIKSKNEGLKKRNIFIVFGLILIVLGGIAAYFFIQKQKLKSSFEKELAIKLTEEKERLRIAKDIHDDLGSGLSKINFLSELISFHKNLNPEIAENAESIADTSKKLVANMRDLIWALDPENVTLSGLIARIREYSTDYLEDFSAKLKLKTDENIPELPITKESHREILMTVKESLNNIVKHSKATLIEIETGIYHELLSISVRDNGIGISESESSGNGLKNMRSRINSVGGEFIIDNNSDQGTLIIVKVPLQKILKG